MTDGEDLFDSLFITLFEGVVLYELLYDQDGQAVDYTIVKVNPAFEAMLNLPTAKIIEQRASVLFDCYPAPMIENFAAVVRNTHHAKFEHYFDCLDAQLSVSLSAHGDNRGLAVFSEHETVKQSMEALKMTRQELKEAQRLSKTGSWHLNLMTSKQVWSDELYNMLRLDSADPPPEFLEAEKLFTAQSWAALSAAIAHTAETGIPYELEMEMIRADGSHGWMLGRGEAVRDELGDIVALRGVALDITDRKKAELELLNEKDFVDKLINIQVDTFFLFNPKTGQPLRWNQSFARHSGYSDEEIAKMRAPVDFLVEADAEKAFRKIRRSFVDGSGAIELDLLTKHGTRIPFEYRVKSIKDNNGTTLLLSLGRDITERKRAEEQSRHHEAELRRIAHYDTLTSIPNRLLLSDRMKQAIAQASREKSVMAVCYLDLDGFKGINDFLGHTVGDRVLIEVANRIKKIIRATDTVARLGGDEFVVLLKDLHLSNECLVTLERLLESIAEPIKVDSATCSVSASIGVSIYPLEDEDPDTLLRHADHAMYVAKQSGKNCYHIYDANEEKLVRDCHELNENIARALKNNEFVLYYQPKINLRTQQLVAVEALIRWQHPQEGLLSPAAFLPKIVNSKLDIELGQWVVTTALAQLHQWNKAGLDIGVSVNISGYHIESSNFVAFIKDQLAGYPDLSPKKFQIEVLETIALSDIHIVRNVIQECQKMGVSFALDDFGTGYSSLTYLSRLPVDVLKIDQSFVRDMLVDKGDSSIVQGIIALAHTFDRQIVAEGIETAEHYQALLSMGCELGQGYYIARPMPAEALSQWRVPLLDIYPQARQSK